MPVWASRRYHNGDRALPQWRSWSSNPTVGVRLPCRGSRLVITPGWDTDINQHEPATARSTKLLSVFLGGYLDSTASDN